MDNPDNRVKRLSHDLVRQARMIQKLWDTERISLKELMAGSQPNEQKTQLTICLSKRGSRAARRNTMRHRIVQALLKYLHDGDHRFFLLLFSSKWFRRGIAVCLLATLAIPMVTMRLLSSTPSGVNPQIKMSVIDWVQARALGRTARKLVETVDSDIRFSTWRQAIGNDRGNMALNRDYLDALIRFDRNRTRWQDSIRTSLWLQRLAPLNRQNADIILRSFAHYRFDQMIIDWVESQPEVNSPVIQQCHLRALFHKGNLKQFRKVWAKANESVKRDPSMSLYQAAVSSTFERGQKAWEAQARLDEAKKLSNSSELAYRLQLRVSYERVDLDRFLIAWSHLRDQFATIAADHFLHWDLLTHCDRRNEAIQAAQRHLQRPRTPHEVIETAEAYSKLGLKKHAIRYLSNYAPDLGFNGMHFYAQAQLLTTEKRWSDIIGLALSIRRSKNVSMPLMAFSYFIEGKGELKRNRKTAAATAFNQIANYSTKASRHGIYIGSNLWELGYAKEAHALLTLERERYRNRIAYWDLMFDIGLALKLQSPLLQAAENLFRLSPETLHYRANYASLLISQRIRHDEALALAFNAYSQSPDNPGMKINYGQALLLNQRIDEARTIFRDIDSKRLDTSQLQGYFLAVTELLYHEGRYHDAKPILKKIIPELLLPGDRVFLESLQHKLLAEGNGA